MYGNPYHIHRRPASCCHRQVSYNLGTLYTRDTATRPAPLCYTLSPPPDSHYGNVAHRKYRTTASAYYQVHYTEHNEIHLLLKQQKNKLNFDHFFNDIEIYLLTGRELKVRYYFMLIIMDEIGIYNIRFNIPYI